MTNSVPILRQKKANSTNDWVRPQRLGRALYGVVFQEKSLLSMINLVRHFGARSFNEEDVSVLKSLMPHLQRAVQLHLRVSRLESQQRLAAEALNRWSLGVTLLDSQGRVVLMNRSAEELVDRNDGLVVRDGQLWAARTTENMELRSLILGAVGRRNGNGIKPGGVMVLPRPSGKRPLSVLVTPACAHPLLLPISRAAAIVFVSDPETMPESGAEVLARLYSLTPSESAVAVLLMLGKNTEEAAEELCTTKNALRFHLKHIFGKTGTRRQGELIRLLLSGPAQLRLP